MHWSLLDAMSFREQSCVVRRALLFWGEAGELESEWLETPEIEM